MIKIIHFKEGEVAPFIDGLINTYQFGSTTGILKSFGKECSVTQVPDYSTTGYATLIFNEGAFIVYGRMIYIEQGTAFKILLENRRSVSIGVKIDLSQPAGNEVVLYCTDQFLTKDNLITNPISGVYYFELYKADLNTTEIILGAKTNPSVETNTTLFNNVNNSLTNINKSITDINNDQIEVVTSLPTSKPSHNKWLIYVGSTAPSTQFEQVIYLITG